MHCQPSSEHFVSLCSCFHDSAALAATPAKTPASEIILGLSGEVTVMSKAEVSLIPQLDTRISAGRVMSSSLPKPHPASRRAGNKACYNYNWFSSWENVTLHRALHIYN